MSLPPDKNIFNDYRNNVGVESGSYRGDGIQAFLDAGFSRIISIEIDPEQITFCKHRFDLFQNPKPEIKLIEGNSAVCLWDAIKDIDEPITFWLDGHYQMIEGVDPGPSPFPLLEEIEQIGRHHIKNHTILIDDMLIMQYNITGYDIGLIQTRIENINPDYKFTMIANPVINGIMCCSV